MQIYKDTHTHLHTTAHSYIQIAQIRHAAPAAYDSRIVHISAASKLYQQYVA